jgi:hypothetical protein
MFILERITEHWVARVLEVLYVGNNLVVQGQHAEHGLDSACCGD